MQNNGNEHAFSTQGKFPSFSFHYRLQRYIIYETKVKSSLQIIYFSLLEQKCQNPGKSIPSPFDSCNICSCSNKGFIEGCTKQLCDQGNLTVYFFELELNCIEIWSKFITK